MIFSNKLRAFRNFSGRFYLEVTDMNNHLNRFENCGFLPFNRIVRNETFQNQEKFPFRIF